MSLNLTPPEPPERIQKWLDQLPTRDIESIRALHYYDCGDEIICLDLNIVAPSVAELDNKVAQRFADDTGDLFNAAPRTVWMEFINNAQWIENRGLHLPIHGLYLVSLHRKPIHG